MRGREKVTMQYLRRRFPEARLLSNTLLEERLAEAGLACQRRRRKTIIPGGDHKRARLGWAEFVMKRHAATLEKWAYSDGTVFYLDKNEEALASRQRAALGSMVWRCADRSDALYDDGVGPSRYHKGQSTLVRIWG